MAVLLRRGTGRGSSVKLSLGRCSALCAALWPPTRMPSTSVARRISCSTLRLGLRRDLTVGRSPSAQRANALMLWIFLAVAGAADCSLDSDTPVSYLTVSQGRFLVGRPRAGQAYGEPCRTHLHILCGGPSSHPSCRTPSTRNSSSTQRNPPATSRTGSPT